MGVIIQLFNKKTKQAFITYHTPDEDDTEEDMKRDIKKYYNHPHNKSIVGGWINKYYDTIKVKILNKTATNFDKFEYMNKISKTYTLINTITNPEAERRHEDEFVFKCSKCQGIFYYSASKKQKENRVCRDVHFCNYVEWQRNNPKRDIHEWELY